MLEMNKLSKYLYGTEGPRYNDSVCYQRFCCKIEFAVIKKLNMDPSKASETDTFEHFLQNICFSECEYLHV